MRITVDKVESSPPHSVTPSDVREVFRHLPSEWISPVKTVRISSSMHSWEIASFSRVTRRLVLCTRGHGKTEVFAAMLRELFSNVTLTHPISEWRLSAKQKKALDAKVDAELSRPQNA